MKTCEGASAKDIDEACLAFVEWLAKSGQLVRARDVIRLLTTTCVVESAYPLKAAMKKAIEDALDSPVTEVVKPDLIGGMRLRVNDRLIDGSISGKLSALKLALNE